MMKLPRIIALASLLGLGWVLWGCGVERRSDSYRCGPDRACPDDRVCEQGWCVLPETDSAPDAMPMEYADAGSPPDATPFECPEACTRCEGTTCVISCGTATSCEDTVVCPPDLPCTVRCWGLESCEGGVDCSAASACSVICSHYGSCRDGVLCGSGPCEVRCSGFESCEAGIDCGDSCACDTDCSGTDACDEGVACPGRGAACEAAGECNSMGCSTC